ncbi:glycosyltransferase family 39 protein [Dactylosporangium sp. NPDC049742]|uniref:glycosyltransferase family 39 protein n=1 Tax=Dactylosporangium sp. NPDC049742 TaxID=3154737 RepID=UPI00341B175F
MQLHLYYGPGVRTMAGSWQAWLYGAYDPQLTTTFDKAPGTFWLQALSARAFGYVPWAVLLPSLLASLASIVLMYRVVREWAGPEAGVAAAGFFATSSASVGRPGRAKARRGST